LKTALKISYIILKDFRKRWYSWSKTVM